MEKVNEQVQKQEKREENSDRCPKCGKNVLENDSNAIGCEGNCKGWFHKDCIGLSTTELSALKSKKANLIWMCVKCKGLLEAFGLNDCPAEMKNAIKTVEENKNTCINIKNKIDEVEKSLLQKMSLLLETQCQMADWLVSNNKSANKLVPLSKSQELETTEDETKGPFQNEQG